MDTGDLRKRILRALDEAKNDAAFRRTEIDAANRAYESFLQNIAVPLLKQSQGVLKAEGQSFSVNAPAGSVRLVSDSSSDTFIELSLDSNAGRPQVLGRTSRARGRQRVIVDERPIVGEKAIADLTEEDLAAFLVAEIPKLVSR
jgi:hypothetical protein